VRAHHDPEKAHFAKTKNEDRTKERTREGEKQHV
jgi:hypothetical protein